MEKEEEEKKKGTNEFYGSCCAFDVGKLSPTGLTWKEVASREEARIRDNFKIKGEDNPTLEMMYSKGTRYIRTLKPNDKIDSKPEFQVDIEFYFPKPSAKSKYEEVVYGRIIDAKNCDEQQYIVEDKKK